jgi:hypothetical protein
MNVSTRPPEPPPSGKLDWLKSHVGESKSTAAYFGHMASCLTKQASR